MNLPITLEGDEPAQGQAEPTDASKMPLPMRLRSLAEQVKRFGSVTNYSGSQHAMLYEAAAAIESALAASHAAPAADLRAAIPVTPDLHLIWNTLQFFAHPDSYTLGERTGGVLQGCPRKPPPTPDEMAGYARRALESLFKAVGKEPDAWMAGGDPAPGCWHVVAPDGRVWRNERLLAAVSAAIEQTQLQFPARHAAAQLAAVAAPPEGHDEFTEGVNAAAAMLDKMADDFAYEHSVVDWETGAREFGGRGSSSREDYYNTLRELADDIRSIVHGNEERAVAAVAAPEARIEGQSLDHPAVNDSPNALRAAPLSEPCALDQGARPVWQPIETAPKDDTLFLAFRRDSNTGRPLVRDARILVRSDGEMWSFGGVQWFPAAFPDRPLPTHWMPLPPAPAGIAPPVAQQAGSTQ